MTWEVRLRTGGQRKSDSQIGERESPGMPPGNMRLLLLLLRLRGLVLMLLFPDAIQAFVVVVAPASAVLYQTC